MDLEECSQITDVTLASLATGCPSLEKLVFEKIFFFCLFVPRVFHKSSEILTFMEYDWGNKTNFIFRNNLRNMNNAKNLEIFCVFQSNSLESSIFSFPLIGSKIFIDFFIFPI